ncbi:hypothetical protein BEP19_00355 [Ammoniphilus oxalaticus]|uniref:Crp/Fnr family transcriptional regulator n=1 Tax=Ammoniphilus oxalaticus TaxID=66863 RepID=A0A419SRB5_9BACL|nr:Crp/Fnr family transcriptional regulator [Ammoniphilus oxalaticus]RKD27060.1 hypothetical protein BEP19_00355 [Ammoniphilus oxalaticus]
MQSELGQMLSRVEIFQYCTEEEIEQVADLLLPREIKRREILFNEGDPCEVVYFIQQGRVKVYKTTEDGREQIVNLLGKGDIFPHVGWYGGSNYPATAESLEDGHFYFMSVDKFVRVLENNPRLTLKLLKEFDEQIRELQRRLSNVLSGDMAGKILNVLHSLAKSKGRKTEDGYLLEIDLTHQDIANMVGTSRETASRVISQLRKEGKLLLEHKSLLVKG